jgi:nucleotide-binding universal stress UspA family protein
VLADGPRNRRRWPPSDAGVRLAYAFEEAALRGAALIAVHSWSWPRPALGDRRGGGDTTGHLADRVAREAELKLAEVLSGWHDKYPAVPVRQDVVHGHPAQVLASYTARADLVVIGRYGGAGSYPTAGRIQHALLGRARGPVAVVPTPG